MQTKKGIVSITTFSFLILLYVSLVIFSYGFYSYSKDDFKSKVNNVEIVESIHKLRSKLVLLSANVNSTLNYSDKYAREDLIVKLKGTNLTGEIIENNKISQESLSLFGLEFCNQKNISLVDYTYYQFNGSCILVN